MKKILIVGLLFAVVGCAGKTANPVPVAQMGDSGMDCDEIRAEMAHTDVKIAQLTPETKKGVKNTALGVAGVFLIVPWFFMDLSDAEKVEIEAYQERSLKLERMGTRKGCTG